MASPKTIAAYIEQYDGEVRERLASVCDLIRSAVPEAATEGIKWRMPAFMLGSEPLFFVTGAKKHLSFYPTGEAITHFAGDLAAYQTTEHAIQFPHAQPLPTGLIRDIIAWRVGQLPAE